MSKDISGLQEILSAPKLRGGLGEYFLGELLAQIMPPKYYELQHHFKSGQAVDAVIKIGDRLVPVDAKFPLESFKRYVEAQEESEKKQFRKEFVNSVKNRIKEIAQRYIVPDENTFEFALMYIPAENVYYEVIIRDDKIDDADSIYQYAIKNKVIPVSPNSFYAYLQVIIFGLRGMQVEESVTEIIELLSRISFEFETFKEDFRVLGKHIGSAKTKFDDSEKRLERFGDKLNLAVNSHRVEDGKKLNG